MFCLPKKRFSRRHGFLRPFIYILLYNFNKNSTLVCLNFNEIYFESQVQSHVPFKNQRSYYNIDNARLCVYNVFIRK